MAGQPDRHVSAIVPTDELWNVTTVNDPDAYEDQLLLTGDAGEFLIRTRGAGLELVVKLTDLKMPGLSPDDQFSRFRIIKARGAEANYGIKGAQEQFPTLSSLVKYYARKPRGAVNDMILQLSGPFTTHLVQASRPASKLLASHGEGTKEQVKSLRRHLPDSKHEQGDWGDSEIAASNTADGIYETMSDIVRRAKGSIHYQSAPKAQLGDYASPSDNLDGEGAAALSTRPKLGAPAEGPTAVYVDAATVKEKKKNARQLSNVVDPPPPPPPPPPTGMPPPPTALPAKSFAGLGGLLSGVVKLKKRVGPSLEDVEKDRKAKAMERRKVPDGFKMPLWVNIDANGPVKHVDPGRIARLLENDPEAKCVLVDFFAYSCTNCLRTVPVLIKWAEKYHKYGLRIVGFHRPEFDFEKDMSNLVRFVEDRGIPYPVGLDNESEAWQAWQVDSWPTHYLIPTPLKAGAELVKAGEPHIGDRNHDELESALVSCLIPRTKDAAAREALIKMKAQIKPANRDLFYDMEFFLGVAHREKNVVAAQNGPDCSNGVCKMPAREKKAGNGGDSVGSARLDFNRNGHQGSIELHGETEDWIARPEFVSPRSDEFKMTVSFNVMAGAADSPSKVTVYMVAAEPSQAGKETPMAVTVDRGCASAAAFVEVEIRWADRHLLGEFDNGSTITITAKRSLKVYSFYMTTEQAAVDVEMVARRPAATGAPTNRVRHDRTSRVPVGGGKPAVFVPADKKITRRPTGQRSKPRNVHPTEADMEFLMPEGSGRSASIRIFNAYAAMHPEETLDGMFTVRESTKMVGAYIIDILGPNGKKVHIMVHSGPGPVIHIEEEDFPDLSTFVQHFRKFPLDLPGMKEKRMDTLKLGKCLATGVSMGGGVVEDAHEDNSKSAVLTSDGKVDQHGELSASPDAGPARRNSIVRIYHTIVVRKLKKGVLPFQVKIVDGEPIVYESIDNGKNQAKNNDVILGVNGHAAKEHNIEVVLKSADKTFTMDVEREWQPSGR